MEFQDDALAVPTFELLNAEWEELNDLKLQGLKMLDTASMRTKPGGIEHLQLIFKIQELQIAVVRSFLSNKEVAQLLSGLIFESTNKRSD